MEIFDMAGVVGPFVEAANRVTSIAVVRARHGDSVASLRSVRSVLERQVSAAATAA